MGAKKAILIVGATGAQGGSVARHLLAGGQFAVRCLTRHPESDRAMQLKTAGAEIVPGDLEKPAGLRAALAGCYGVFGVTNYWEHFDREYELGKNLVDAVAGSEVEHFILSTLPGAKKITNGKLEVPHFDIKARLEEYARGLDLPATYVQVAFYYENFLTLFPPRREPGGSYSYSFPQGDVPLAAVAAEDAGGVVAALFARPGEFRRKVVGIIGDEQPVDSYAESVARAAGVKVAYRNVPRDVFAASGLPGAQDMANMFELYRLFMPSRRKEMERCRMLYPQLRDFASWAMANSERFQAIAGRGAAGRD